MRNEIFRNLKYTDNFQNFEELLNELFSARAIREFKVLDFGCGKGRNLTLFPTFERIGVDISKTKIMTAKNYGQVVLASGECLPFKDSCFDIIITDMVLHHLTEFRLGLLEIRKCLRPGGVLLFNEVVEDNPLISIARMIHPYYEDMPVKSRFRKEELNEWLRDHDFRITICGQSELFIWIWNALVNHLNFLDRITPMINSLEAWLIGHLNKFTGHYFGLALLHPKKKTQP